MPDVHLYQDVFWGGYERTCVILLKCLIMLYDTRWLLVHLKAIHVSWNVLETICCQAVKSNISTK